MTTSRMSATAIALSIAFGFVEGAGSTQRSAKDQNLPGRIASSKRMADGKEWLTANLNVNTSSSYCYDDAEPNCRRYGRLYTWESAKRGCQSLGDGWRLPTDDEWRQMAKHFGGLGTLTIRVERIQTVRSQLLLLRRSAVAVAIAFSASIIPALQAASMDSIVGLRTE